MTTEQNKTQSEKFYFSGQIVIGSLHCCQPVPDISGFIIWKTQVKLTFLTQNFYWREIAARITIIFDEAF